VAIVLIAAAAVVVAAAAIAVQIPIHNLLRFKHIT
jgi:hypothetical protein